MRLNKLLALATGTGRRQADNAIAAARVQVNGVIAKLGQMVSESDVVTLDGQPVRWPAGTPVTIMFNKPVGCVVSRAGQGSRTIYDLLPPEYQQLKPVGRLDKNSSGLLLLTNDGKLAQELTHPSKQKLKVYEVRLDKPLQPLHQQMITDYGILLDDGPSKFQIEPIDVKSREKWKVVMTEGRNRQIRRTFASLGYSVTLLHRLQFGSYRLERLLPGQWLPTRA